MGKPALLLALFLSSAAPVAAWAAYAGLGLHLAPGHWTGWTSWTSWTWVLLLAPALEEFCLRPLLQAGVRHQLDRIRVDGLRSWFGWGADWRGHFANSAVALVFAALHAPANGLLAFWWLVPALAIGEVYRRSGSGWLCVLLHAWFNASLAGVTLLMR